MTEQERNERDDLYSYISDTSKMIDGRRIRFDYMSMPLEDLHAEYEYWMRRNQEYMTEDDIYAPDQWDLEYLDAQMCDFWDEMDADDAYWEEIDAVYERLEG